MAIVRSDAQSYAIGSAMTGTSLKSAWAEGNYRMGWVASPNYTWCGWILAAELHNNGGGEKICGDGYTMPTSQFMAGVNCACDAGKRVFLTSSSEFYLNARPWMVPAQPNDYRRPLAAGRCVEWRYVTKDGNWVMVKDRKYPDQQGSWGFIRRSSLPSTLPTGQEICVYPY